MSFFRRNKKAKPKIGDLRVVVEQTGIGQWLAKVKEYQWMGWGDYKGWDDASDSKELLAPYDTIINFFEAETAEEACKAAHYLIDVIKVRKNWANARREC